MPKIAHISRIITAIATRINAVRLNMLVNSRHQCIAFGALNHLRIHLAQQDPDLTINWNDASLAEQLEIVGVTQDTADPNELVSILKQKREEIETAIGSLQKCFTAIFSCRKNKKASKFSELMEYVSTVCDTKFILHFDSSIAPDIAAVLPKTDPQDTIAVRGDHLWWFLTCEKYIEQNPDLKGESFVRSCLRDGCIDKGSPFYALTTQLVKSSLNTKLSPTSEPVLQVFGLPSTTPLPLTIKSDFIGATEQLYFGSHN